MNRGLPIAALCVAAAVPAQAQPTSTDTSGIPQVKAGSLIRIESTSIRGRQMVGRLTAADDATVSAVVSGGGTMTVPWSRITRISTSDGRDQGINAVRGAVIGLSAIVVAYPILRTNTTRAAALPVAVALPLAGAALGWFVAPHRWNHILWRPATDPVGAPESTLLRLAPETELVVRTGRRQVRARLLDITADSIALRRSADTVRFLWPQVSELRARGRRNHPRGAAYGISAMALATGIQFAVANPAHAQRQSIFLGNVLVGGAIGLLVGAPGWTTIPAPSGR